MLMTLVLVQQQYLAAYSFSEAYMARVCVVALILMLVCTIPSIICSVRNRRSTTCFALEGALMFLSASVGSRYLLRHGSEAYALVFVQVVLVHIFYTLSRVAHEHKHRHLLAYRAPVRIVAGAAAVVLPAALGVRCPVHDVDIPMVLLVMFAGEVLGCLAVVVAAVLQTFGTLYEQVWDA